MEKRIVFHLDMDAFFASVEIVHRPELKGKPVIVGGKPGSRGVVSTCSYEARLFGVHSAMSLKEASKRCPHAIFIEGNYSLYRDYSDNIMTILKRVSPCVEVVGIDEAYLDVTEVVTKYGTAQKLAALIKKVIFKRYQLTCTIGIASNKLVAKIASGLGKPNGIYEVISGEEATTLAPLPIQVLPGVGAKTQLQLNKIGIKTVGDLQAIGLERLLSRFGSWGYYFFQAAHGIDKRPVDPSEHIPKSLGAETTFEKDLSDRKLLKMILLKLAEKVWRHLRDEKKHAGAITLKLRDYQFRTKTRARQLFSDTNQLKQIQQEAVALFDLSYDGLPLRLIGLSLHKLTEEYWQPALWDWTEVSIQ